MADLLFPLHPCPETSVQTDSLSQSRVLGIDIRDYLRAEVRPNQKTLISRRPPEALSQLSFSCSSARRRIKVLDIGTDGSWQGPSPGDPTQARRYASGAQGVVTLTVFESAYAPFTSTRQTLE